MQNQRRALNVTCLHTNLRVRFNPQYLVPYVYISIPSRHRTKCRLDTRKLLRASETRYGLDPAVFPFPPDLCGCSGTSTPSGNGAASFHGERGRYRPYRSRYPVPRLVHGRGGFRTRLCSDESLMTTRSRHSEASTRPPSRLSSTQLNQLRP